MTYLYIYRHPYNDRCFSQIIRHFLSYFISQIEKIIHIHVPYNTKELNTYFSQLFNVKMITDMHIDDIDISKLKQKKLIYSQPDQNLVGLYNIKKQYNVNDIFSDKNINLMRKAYQLSKVGVDYDLSKINICIHIRRGDIVKYGINCGRFTPLSFFINIINKLKHITNCDFHIYSDSKIDLGINLPNIKYHINTDLLITIHEMIMSDIFIMSIGSNLSLFAALLTKGIVFLDKSKLKPCFNNNYNIYMAKHNKIITEENIFLDSVDTFLSLKNEK